MKTPLNFLKPKQNTVKTSDIILGITIAAMASAAIAFLISEPNGKPIDERLTDFVREEFGSHGDEDPEEKISAS